MIHGYYRSIHVIITSLSLFLFFCGAIQAGFYPVAADMAGWQPVDTPGWVSAEIPPGWELLSVDPGDSPGGTVMIEAVSPDSDSHLVYFIERTDNAMARGEMEAFQNQWMKAEGYRVCKTHDPEFRMKADHTSLTQVYVQGTDNGAVMVSAGYPGWGMTHAALLMEGRGAVETYYELLPGQFGDHILPVSDTDSDAGTTDAAILESDHE